MTWGPSLQNLARAAVGDRWQTEPRRPTVYAESVTFELHYDGNPQMGFLGTDLAILDREHRRFGAATRYDAEGREGAELLLTEKPGRARMRPLPRRDGLIVEGPRRGSFNLDSFSGEALDAAMRNPEAYASFFSRVIRWGKAKIRRKSPSGTLEEQDLRLPTDPPDGKDDKERVSQGARWRGHWKYPDGTEIEIEYEG